MTALRVASALSLLTALAASAATPTPTSDLESLREILSKATWAQELQLPPPFSVNGVVHSSHFEIVLGSSYSFTVISEPRRSELFLFDLRTGRLLEQRQSSEVVSATVADLDADAVPEVLLDTVDGWGSGILLRNFHLLKVGDSGWKELWSGVSWSYDSQQRSEATVALGVPDHSSFRHSVTVNRGGRSETSSSCHSLSEGLVHPCSPEAQ